MNFNNVNSAKSFMQQKHLMDIEMHAKREQLNNLNQQTEEAKKQTSLLEETKEISHENVMCTKQMISCTLENQQSSNRQFMASMIMSIVAIGIALISLIYGVISSNNTSKLYEQQLQKQDKIIELLKNNKLP